MLVSGSRVIQRKIVFAITPEMLVLQKILGVPGAVIQVGETHFGGSLIYQENVGRVQIGVNNVLAVQNLSEVNHFDGDIDGLVLRKQGPLGTWQGRL